MIRTNNLLRKIFSLCILFLAFSSCYSQSLINPQIESTYRDAVKHVEPASRQWINTTKTNWIKNPELSSLHNLINKQYVAYNGREKELIALIVIVESIKENEKEHQDLKLQGQSLLNDETKLSVIKNRLTYQPDAGSASYFQAAESIISKYSAPINKPAIDKHAANSTKKNVDTAKTRITPFSQDSIPALMKNIETTLTDLHARRQAAEAAFQPADQRMNRLGQLLTTVNKSVTDLRNLPLRIVL